MNNYAKVSLLKNQILKDASEDTSYIAGICKTLAVSYMKGCKVLGNNEFGSLGIFSSLPWECDNLRQYAYTDNGVICLPIKPTCPVYGCLVVRVYFDGKVEVEFREDEHEPMPEEVLAEVFAQMLKDFEFPVELHSTKKVVVVDIDGTVADCSERAKKFIGGWPKDWDSFYGACAEDKPIWPIIHLVQNLMGKYKIVFCSGRRESCRKDTLEWLQRFFGPLDNVRLLLSRGDGDHRHDTEVKPELMETNGLSVDKVAFILEDRNSMAAKWRELGYTCLQVADGNF